MEFIFPACCFFSRSPQPWPWHSTFLCCDLLPPMQQHIPPALAAPFAPATLAWPVWRGQWPPVPCARASLDASSFAGAQAQGCVHVLAAHVQLCPKHRCLSRCWPLHPRTVSRRDAGASRSAASVAGALNPRHGTFQGGYPHTDGLGERGVPGRACLPLLGGARPARAWDHPFGSQTGRKEGVCQAL